MFLFAHARRIARKSLSEGTFSQRTQTLASGSQNVTGGLNERRLLPRRSLVSFASRGKVPIAARYGVREGNVFGRVCPPPSQ